MMKKLKIMMLSALACLGLAGCNKQIFDFDYKFDKIHINSTNQCYAIKSWTDYEDGEQIQVKFEDGSTMIISSFNCQLIKGTCPICGH